MEEFFHKKLGERIKSIRTSQNRSREDIAFEVGVSGSYIGMIERGENDFKTSKLYNISKALKIPLSELLKDI